MPAKNIIAIDLGGTNLKVALLDLNLSIRNKHIFDTQSFKSKSRLISSIKSSVDLAVKKSCLLRRDVLGVGIGLPGPVDFGSGVVHFLPNIPGWRNVGLKKILAGSLKLPVFVDNDAKLMALAEHRKGAARGMDNALCLTLGTGVGAGLIIRGDIYRGGDNAAGEIGHMPLNEDGPACNCGGRACLESYIGNKKILKNAERLFGRRISLEELSSLAARGNSKAVSVWREVGERLGIALSGITNMINPDGIIIGGGVANAGEVLFESVRKTIRKRAMCVQSARVKVLRARLGSDAGLIGAGIIVREGLKR